MNTCGIATKNKFKQKLKHKTKQVCFFFLHFKKKKNPFYSLKYAEIKSFAMPFT